MRFRLYLQGVNLYRHTPTPAVLALKAPALVDYVEETIGFFLSSCCVKPSVDPTTSYSGVFNHK
jgi:hypothetical protein